MIEQCDMPHGGEPLLAAVKAGVVSEEELGHVRRIQQESGKRLGQVIAERGWASDEELALLLSLDMGVPLIDMKWHQVQPKALELVPAQLAFRHRVIGLDVVGNALVLAMADPEDIRARDDVASYTGMEVLPAVAYPQDVCRAIEVNYGLRGELDSELWEGPAKAVPLAEQAEGQPRRNLGNQIEEQLSRLAPKSYEDGIRADMLLSTVSEAPIVRSVDLIVRQAVRDRASDVHIEPQRDRLRIRYRIDGILHDVASISLDYHSPLLSRIKVLAQIDIAERRRPQDGQLTYDLKDKQVDIRVATFNTVYGEMAVLRILDKSLPLFSLSELGFLSESLTRYGEVLRSPLGMVVVSGPTGAGKTTTLYASLNQLDNAERKIITVEDPVEYQFDDICPSEINPKADITFASGLRAIMRLDPDVILVGEVRDSETANTSIQAALTGHLVLSSVHANDAAGVIFRLLHLGIEPFLLSSALIGIVAQRMVRRVCPHCSDLAEAGPEEKVAYQEEMGEARTHFYYGAGCNRCSGTGYLGRTGVFEVLLITEEFRKLILSGASTDELRAQAVKDGMITMRRDGMIKVKRGITTPREVLRNVFSISSEGRSTSDAKEEAPVEAKDEAPVEVREEAPAPVEAAVEQGAVSQAPSAADEAREAEHEAVAGGAQRVEARQEAAPAELVGQRVPIVNRLGGTGGEVPAGGGQRFGGTEGPEGPETTSLRGASADTPPATSDVEGGTGGEDGHRRLFRHSRLEALESLMPGGNFLETYVSEHMSDVVADMVPVRIRSLPEVVWATVLYLRGKHPKLDSGAHVSAALIEVGLPVLEEMVKGVPSFKELMDRAYLEGDESQRLELLKSQFDVHISANKLSKTVYCSGEKTWKRLKRIADHLGIAQSNVAVLALEAGMAQSLFWLPDKHRNNAAQEIAHFEHWLAERQRSP